MQEYEQTHEASSKAVEELRSRQEATSFSLDALQRDQDKVKRHLVKTQKEVQVRGRNSEGGQVKGQGSGGGSGLTTVLYLAHNCTYGMDKMMG